MLLLEMPYKPYRTRWNVHSIGLCSPMECSGPQVWEIGDWKISQRPSVKTSQSPHEARSAKWGD